MQGGDIEWKPRLRWWVGVGQFGCLKTSGLDVLSSRLSYSGLTSKRGSLGPQTNSHTELPKQLLHPEIGSLLWAGIPNCVLNHSGKWDGNVLSWESELLRQEKGGD